MQEKMAKALDLVGNEKDIEIQKQKSESILKRLGDWFDSTIEYWKPFQKEMRDIEVGYDKSIFGFYQIMQHMFIFSVFTVMIFSYLLVTHYLKYKDTVQYYSGNCGYFFPCIFFYSRFQEDAKFAYAMTNLVFLVVGLSYCMYMWIKFDKKAKY